MNHHKLRAGRLVLSNLRQATTRIATGLQFACREKLPVSVAVRLRRSWPLLLMAMMHIPGVAADSTDTVEGADNFDVEWRPSDFTRLVFHEDFAASALDRTTWCTRYQYGGGPPLPKADPECGVGGRGTLDYLNDEEQRFVDITNDGEDVHLIDNGVLRLMAYPVAGMPAGKFQSGMIRSKQKFAPSATLSLFITARIRLPTTVGAWPGFWLAPGVDASGRTGWPPEIDIVEAMLNPSRGDHATKIHMGTQLQNFGGKGVAGKASLSFAHPNYDRQTRRFNADRSLRGAWMVASVEWSEKTACFYVGRTRVACHQYEWKLNSGEAAPDAPLLLNLSMGGLMGGAVDYATMPTSFDIDYVKVYTRIERHN